MKEIFQKLLLFVAERDLESALWIAAELLCNLTEEEINSDEFNFLEILVGINPDAVENPNTKDFALKVIERGELI